MSRIAVVFIVVLSLVCGLFSIAAAHSTAGRIKIDLTKDAPNTDDFAYFMESFVHRELYRDKFPKWKKRFYVKDFKSVEMKDNRAVVHFLTLDNKEKSDFADSMPFSRGQDGVWFYENESGKKFKVYTYVKKWGYYYQKYILPGSIAGLFLSISGFTLLQIRKRKQAKAILAADQ